MYWCHQEGGENAVSLVPRHQIFRTVSFGLGARLTFGKLTWDRNDHLFEVMWGPPLHQPVSE